jgi:membrane protein required for colicin V production
MNFLDLLIGVFVLLFVILGYRKGFIISLATILALILGIYLAVHFSNFMDQFLLYTLKPSRSWLPILSFAITFLLVVAGVLIIARLMEKIVDVVGMGFLNHLGGAILGFAKGVIFCSIILFIVTSFDPKEKGITMEDKKGSITYRTISSVFPSIIKLMGSKIKFPEINPRSP